MLTLPRAKELLATTTTEGHLFEHAQAVSACMGAMAAHFGADAAYWQAVGYLHDYDYQQYPDAHLQHTEQPLRDAGVEEEAVYAILAHGYGLCNQVEPQSPLDKSLYTVDELSGLIAATAKMNPEGIAGVKVSSVKKKFKDKKFAAKIDRAVILDGCSRLGMELGEVIEICLAGMLPYADVLGIGPKAGA
ncbi:MAG: hypothetical protein PHO10_01700 [Gemmiger sp.]|nr:hypothetical protein [Gemmiger sp.]